MKNSLVLFFLLFYITSCDNSECNKIKFADSFDEVQKNIILLDSLLKYSNNKCDADYAVSFDDNIILIKNAKVDDKFRKIYLCDSVEFSINKFNKIINILKKNNIKYAYRDYSTDMYVFGYCNNDYVDGSLSRGIVINVNNNEYKINIDHKIIDKKSKLILVSPRY